MIPVGMGDLTSSLASSIAQFEGYNKPGSVAQRNNNPGNLRSGPGQIGTDSLGFAIFPDAATGWAALDNQVNLNVARGLTLQQFFAGEPGVYAGYAPSADSNNPTQYANFVASQAGIPTDVPLNQLSSAGAAVPPVDTSSPDSADSTDQASVSSGISPTVLLVGGAAAILGLLIFTRQ